MAFGAAAISGGARLPVPAVIDRKVALSVAARTGADNPLASSYLLSGLGDSLGSAMTEACAKAAEVTGWQSPALPEAVVMERSAWVDANLSSIAHLLKPALERRSTPDGSLFGAAGRWALRAAISAQFGAVLGMLSSKVIGQYDPFSGSGRQVWFIGPNVVALERKYGFVPAHFRGWVALHEETHRLQFEAHPWMAPYFLNLVHELIRGLDAKVGTVLSGNARHQDSKPLFRYSPMNLLPKEHRERLERIQALMTLLEGHATVIADNGGAQLYPSYRRMRKTFDARRPPTLLARLLERMFGLDLKRMQYLQGREFVEAALRRGGREAVNEYFVSADTMPTLRQIQEQAGPIAH